jgi:hypothetical protein
MEDKTMECGLLLEAARAQQTLAQTVLEKLTAHLCALDDVVREEISRTLVDELQVLGNDSRRAAEALRVLGRSVNLRVALWSVGMVAPAFAERGCGLARKAGRVSGQRRPARAARCAD